MMSDCPASNGEQAVARVGLRYARPKLEWTSVLLRPGTSRYGAKSRDGSYLHIFDCSLEYHWYSDIYTIKIRVLAESVDDTGISWIRCQLQERRQCATCDDTM